MAVGKGRGERTENGDWVPELKGGPGCLPIVRHTSTLKTLHALTWAQCLPSDWWGQYPGWPLAFGRTVSAFSGHRLPEQCGWLAKALGFQARDELQPLLPGALVPRPGHCFTWRVDRRPQQPPQAPWCVGMIMSSPDSYLIMELTLLLQQDLDSELIKPRMESLGLKAALGSSKYFQGPRSTPPSQGSSHPLWTLSFGFAWPLDGRVLCSWGAAGCVV